MNEMKNPRRLSDNVIRAGWEAERGSIRKWLLEEKKFNPQSVDKFIDNFIKSMVFANVPCTTVPGVEASCQFYIRERSNLSEPQ